MPALLSFKIPYPSQANQVSVLVTEAKRALIVHVKLDLRQKQTLYYELGRFLRSGIPLPQAVEALAQDSGRGSLRHVLERLTALLLSGHSVPAAFANLQPTVGSLELALVEAASTSGRLEQAFAYLSTYFGSLYEVRAGILRQAAWPLIQLHFGILVINGAGQLASNHSIDARLFTEQCGRAFGVLYLGAVLVWLAAALLLKTARTNSQVDRLLNLVPIIGRLRRNMALSRFCAAYEMQLQAAINVMDGLTAAANASQSATIRDVVAGMIPAVRAGSALGPLFAGARVFPNALQRAIRVGEQTGSLDEDLHNWADYYQKASIVALDALGVWVPRIIFFLIAGYLGYEIVLFYSGMMQDMEHAINAA